MRRDAFVNTAAIITQFNNNNKESVTKKSFNYLKTFFLQDFDQNVPPPVCLFCGSFLVLRATI